MNEFELQPLHLAALVGDEGLLRRILAQGALVNARDTFGRTALYIAAEQGNGLVARVMLDAGALPSVVALGRNTALHVAAYFGHADIIELLLSRGAEIDARNKKGATALLIALQQGHAHCVSTLVEHGAGRNVRVANGLAPIHFAVLNNDVASLRALLADGDVFNQYIVNQVDQDSRSALHIAALNDYEDCLEVLLAHHGKLEIVDRNGDTPLLTAVRSESVRCLRKLLEKGASTAVINEKKMTIIHLVAEWRKAQSLRELIYFGRKNNRQFTLEAPCEGGKTALHIAAENNQADCIRVLEEAGVDLDARSAHGWTALHWASALGNSEAIKALIEEGADSMIRCSGGRTALHVAVEKNQVNSVIALIRGQWSDAARKALIEASLINGKRALHLAADSGLVECIDALVMWGAEVDAQTTEGHNALHIASVQGHVKAVDLLISLGISAASRTKSKKTALELARENNKRDCEEKIQHQLIEELWIAAGKGDVDSIRLLLAAGANIDGLSSLGLTSLHEAARSNNFGVLDVLLAARARTDIQARNGLTPLQLAAQFGYVNNIRALANEGGLNTLRADGFTELQLAARDNRVEIVRGLLAAGAQYDVRDASGMTALHHAALNGHAGCAIVLLEGQGRATINMQTINGRTPLICAAMNNRLSVVQKLLEVGADRTIADTNGFTPPQVAAHFGHSDCVRALAIGGNLDVLRADGQTELHRAILDNRIGVVRGLLAAGARTNIYNKEGKTPLYCAVDLNLLDVVKSLLDAGASMNGKDDRDTGITAFQHAARNNRVAILNEFIGRQGLLIDAVDNAGMTALHWASFKGNVECVAALAEHTAQINQVSLNGRTALHDAVQQNHKEVAKKLLALGADRDICEKYGYTSLQEAAYHGSTDCVKLLAKDGNVNSYNAEGLTELHIAAKAGRERVIIGLLSAGADPELRDKKEGRTALHWAAYHGRTACVSLLAGHVADINQVCSKGRTALHFAIEENDLGSVNRLLELGAKVHLRDNLGYTSLHEAAYYGRSECLKALFKIPDAENASNSMTKNGSTALDLAIMKGHSDAAVLMVRAGGKTKEDILVALRRQTFATMSHDRSIFNPDKVTFWLLSKV